MSVVAFSSEMNGALSTGNSVGSRSNRSRKSVSSKASAKASMVASRYADSKVASSKGSLQVQQQLKREKQQTALQDSLLRLQKSLARYVRTNDRRMMMRTMKDCRQLNCIALDSLDTSILLFKTGDEWLELEDEVSKSRITLNGIQFAGKEPRKRREMMDIIKKLSEVITENIETLPGERLYRELLVRMGRDSATTELTEKLEATFGCSPDIVLQPPKRTTPLPIELKMYESDGQVHAVCSTKHPYGIFRKTDLSIGSKRPWIRFTATVYERVNLSTGKSMRSCSVEVLE